MLECCLFFLSAIEKAASRRNGLESPNKDRSYEDEHAGDGEYAEE